MITTTSISVLNARLSAFVDFVRQGNEVLATDRGQLLARLAPVKGGGHLTAGRSRRRALLDAPLGLVRGAAGRRRA